MTNLSDSQQKRFVSLIAELRNRTSKVGPLHSFWDVIFDMEAFAKGAQTMVIKTESEWIETAEQMLGQDSPQFPFPTIPHPSPTDLIRCTDCRHSKGALHRPYCGAFSYFPAILERRCEKFWPREHLKDQRCGAERWPQLLETPKKGGEK